MSLVRVSVVTGNSASGFSCIEELLTRYKSSVGLIKAGFRDEKKSEKLRNSSFYDPNVVQIISGIAAVDKESLLKVFSETDFALIVTPLDWTVGTENDAALTVNMIHAAVEAGVKHIVVVTSWTAIAPERLSILSARFLPSEILLKELGESKGLKWTVLRGGSFNINVAHAYKDGVLRFPEGYAAALVDVSDIGKSGAAIFVSSDPNKHHGKYYEMNGPKILTSGEVANILSERLERPVTLQSFPPTSEVLEKMTPLMKELVIYLAAEKEKACPFTNDVFELTGQWGDLGTWVSKNKDQFH